MERDNCMIFHASLFTNKIRSYTDRPTSFVKSLEFVMALPKSSSLFSIDLILPREYQILYYYHSFVPLQILSFYGSLCADQMVVRNRIVNNIFPECIRSSFRFYLSINLRCTRMYIVNQYDDTIFLSPRCPLEF